MNPTGNWKYRTLFGAILLGCAGFPVFGNAALPPDTALTIPKEDGFDALAIEGVSNVTLYSQSPETWTVTELTGTWRKKRLDGGTNGIRELTAVDLDAAARELLVTPAPTNAVWQEGFGVESAVANDRSLLLTEFSLPARPDPERQSCLVVFDQVGACHLYLNGIKIGSHGGSWVPWTLDVTTNAVAGRNILALSFPKGGHLAAESRVLLASPVLASRILINPDIRKNEINVRMVLRSNRAKPFATTLRAEINAWKEKPILSTEEKELTIEPGETWATISVKIPEPVFWSPENPHLYELRLFDKECLCYGKERYGFREFVAKGRHFYLNGKPFRLFGMQWNGLRKLRNTAFMVPLKTGEGLLTFGKRYHTAYLKGFKWAGLNSIRPHSDSGFRGRELFETCDELGILNYDDWSTSRVIFQDTPGPLDQLMAGEFAAREEWLYYGYNHPSTALYSFGNERYGALARNLDALYCHLKPLDEQNRPQCSSSGRIPTALTAGTRDRIDFGDDHSYFGTMVGSWLFNRDYYANLKLKFDAMYGPDTLPLVNFELGGGFLTRYENIRMWDQINAIVNASPVDREAYCKMAAKAGESGWEVIARLTLLQRGLRVAATDEKEVHLFAAENMRRIWELIRQQDILDGVGPHQAENFLLYGENQPMSLMAATNKAPRMKVKSTVIDPTRREFIKTPALYTMKRAYRPEVIQARWFDRNLIAGSGAIETQIFAINDSSEGHAYTARILFRDPQGKVLDGQTLEFGDIPANSRKTAAFTCPVRKGLATGSYWLELFLVRDARPVSDNRYEVMVFAPADAVAPVQTSKKVALYGGAGGTAQILKALKVRFDDIRDLKDLGRYTVLIIGGNAMDETITRGGETIRQWIEGGGRLLCFDQKQTGFIPWATAMTLVSAQAAEVADIIEPAHPAFAGLEPRHFDTWSGKGTLYDNTLSPLNDSAIAIAPNGYVMNENFAGNGMADIAIGKGVSLISTFTVTDRFGKDAVATRLAQNLVRYIVSDETTFSRPVKAGRPMLMLKTDDCDLLDLKPWFNSSFMDEMANDGRGGWDDYGPDNDLRNMIVGKQLLAGVPFMVVDPRSNSDRSCIILQHERWPRLPKSVSMKIGGMYNALYFLHTSTCTGRKPGEPLSSYVIRFEDGTQDELVIRNGVHVTDWMSPNNELPSSVLAWTGSAANRMAGVYFTEWRNPKPNVRIVGVDFVGTGKNVAVLMAVTGYKGSLERGWLAPEHTHSK
jgi:hypothetical protein